MAKPPAPPIAAWTKNHDEALMAMMAMKIPKKEAQNLLQQLPPGSTPDLTRAAFKMRQSGRSNPQPVPGGPQGAVPVVPAQPTKPTQAAVAQTQGPPPAPPLAPPSQPPSQPPSSRAPSPAGAQSAGPQKWWQYLGGPQGPPPLAPFGSPGPKTAKAPKGPQERSMAEKFMAFLGGAPKLPGSVTKAPAKPSAAPAPGPQTGPQAQPKPRIRVRTTGREVPPAPLAQGGAKSPAMAPQTQAGPIRIRTPEEFERLAPGTEFIWPDGHIYTKD